MRHQGCGDGSPGRRTAGFTYSPTAAGLIALLVLSCGDGAVEPTPPAAPVATTVTVNPSSASFAALEETTRFTAEVRDQNGQVMTGVAVAWASSDASVASVDASGLVTAAANGSATITASTGSVSGTAAVTVAQVVSAVAVSPSEGMIEVGGTLRLAAEAFDENGHAVDGTAFSWSSSNAEIALVDNSGLVTAIAGGTARITARADDASGIAEVTVENPDRASLVALYEATEGPNWIDNTNWLTDAPLGEWYGVETDASGRVVRIDLGGKRDNETHEWVRHGLAGSIPPELGDLANLRDLHLGRNSLRGVIPPELGGLANLETLVLEINILTGSIPPGLGNLGRLEALWLDNNALAGPIPPELVSTMITGCFAVF